MKQSHAEVAKRQWETSFTTSDWGLGFEVTFPSKSTEFFMGTKLQVHFGLTIYLGPFTLEWRRPPTVLEYESAAAQAYYEGLNKGHL
jgi:hypothetical protein